MVAAPLVSRLFIYTVIVAVIAGALMRPSAPAAHAPVAVRAASQPLS